MANDNGISGLKVLVDSHGNPRLSLVWKHGGGGTSPIVANGVLYFAQADLIQALNPVNGSIMWSSTDISDIHWESPIMVNGVLYITDQAGSLTAFSLNGIIPASPYTVFFPRVNN